MEHESALAFLKNIGRKMHLQIAIVTPAQNDSAPLDFGLREFLSVQDRYAQLFRDRLLQTKPNTIYRLTDEFACSYLYLLLPNAPRHTVIIAGPYITFRVNQEEMLQQAAQHGIPPRLHKKLMEYYQNLPVIQDTSVLTNLFSAFGETIWGGADQFEIQDLALEGEPDPLPPISIPEESNRQQLLLDMQLMQQRYDHENELMQIVSLGQIHRAEQLSMVFAPTMLRSRSADPMRNMKNYCIIGNTLMRKAAEHGGVHPVYLDRISTEFALRIEAITTASTLQELFGDMVRSYCRLVRKHTAQHYSPQVEKAVLCIDSDLSRDLSLHAVAQTLRVSPAYLSRVFRQETGVTLTEYVTQRRMDYAASLLRSTKLQIQTIAQHCGIVDVQYFSRLFRKIHSCSPNEYRKLHADKP